MKTERSCGIRDILQTNIEEEVHAGSQNMLNILTSTVCLNTVGIVRVTKTNLKA
jgi:hypothetical protein